MSTHQSSSGSGGRGRSPSTPDTRASSSSTIRRTSTPITGDVTSTPNTRAPSSSSARRTSTPVAGDVSSTLNSRAPSSSTTRRASTPIAGAFTSTPVSSQTSSSPVAAPKSSTISNINMNVDEVHHVKHQYKKDEWHRTAALTRDYEDIQHDLTSLMLEPRPAKSPTVSPTEMQKYQARRRTLLSVPNEAGFWYTPSTASSYDGILSRSDWEMAVLADIRKVLEGVVGEKEKQASFFQHIAASFASIMEERGRIEMSEYADVLKEALRVLDMKFDLRGMTILKAIAEE